MRSLLLALVALVLLLVTVFVVTNLIVDLLYGLLDASRALQLGKQAKSALDGDFRRFVHLTRTLAVSDFRVYEDRVEQTVDVARESDGRNVDYTVASPGATFDMVL